MSLRLSKEHSFLSANLLFGVAIAGSQLNYMIVAFYNASDQRMTLLFSPEFFAGIVFIAGVFYLNFNSSPKGHLQAACKSEGFWLLLLACWMTFSSLISLFFSLRYLFTFWAPFMYYICSFKLMIQHSEDITSKGHRALVIVMCCSLLFLLSFSMSGRITFSDAENIGIQKIGLGADLSSTEIAIFTGMHIFYLTSILGNLQRIGYRIIVYTLLAVEFWLIVKLFSLSAFLALFIVAVYYAVIALKQRNARKAILLMISTIIIIPVFTYWLSDLSVTTVILEKVQASVESKLNLQYQGYGRTVLTEYMLKLIRENPVFGIGFGQFYESNRLGWQQTKMPSHNNFLSLAVENGLVCGILYFAFIASFLWSSIRTLIALPVVARKQHFRLFWFTVAAVAIVIYQQIRGLFHDTWQIKELYIWAGLAAAGVRLLRIADDSKATTYKRN